MKRLLCSLVAASGLLLSAAGANATTASFSIQGGVAGVLPSGPGPGQNFISGLPAGWSAANFGIGDGTAVTIFDSADIGGKGLFVSPENVSLTFTYEGHSSAFVNQSEASFTFSNLASLFNTQTSTYGVSSYTAPFNVGPAPGLVPFAFNSLCFTSKPCDRFAPNGGPITNPNLSIAFDLVSPTVAYAFLDDSGLNNGSVDYNDMIVQITAVSSLTGTPLPASIVLFAGGLSLLGFAGMRKRRKGVPETSLRALA